MAEGPGPPKVAGNIVKVLVLAMLAMGLLAFLGAGLLILALTFLGNDMADKFEAVQAEICAQNPDDPGCKPKR